MQNTRADGNISHTRRRTGVHVRGSEGTQAHPRNTPRYPKNIISRNQSKLPNASPQFFQLFFHPVVPQVRDKRKEYRDGLECISNRFPPPRDGEKGLQDISLGGTGPGDGMNDDR